MATYNPIHAKIWSDPWFMDLRPPARLLFMYLLTSPETVPSGLFHCPIKKMAFDAGLTPKRAEEALEALKGHVEYDPETALVWVVNAANYWRDNAKVIAAIRKQVEAETGHGLVQGFRDRHPWVWQGQPYPSDTPPIPQRQERKKERKERKERKQWTGPPQAPALKPAIQAFLSAKQPERVARLVDLCDTLGFERNGGHCAAIVRKYGHGREVVRAAQDAVTLADGDPYEYMEGVLRNAKVRGDSGGKPRHEPVQGAQNPAAGRRVTAEEVIEYRKREAASARDGPGGQGGVARPVSQRGG